MAQTKFDGVIEAVRCAPDGQVQMVRLYERRGATFSDRVLVQRSDLVARMKSGQRFVTGQRQPYLGSTFSAGKPLRLVKTAAGEFLTIGTAAPTGQDDVQDTPRF